MQTLILPSAGRIRHLFHISDLHIRTGDRLKARYHEYQSVLQRFVKTIEDWPAEQRDAAVTVITGDLFHHKLKIESAGLDLLMDFLSQLTIWTPVYILRGNHDYRQESPDEMDMLSPLLLKTGLRRVCYLDSTGHYIAGDVGFGLVTVQDALMKGAAAGRIEKLPDFPDAAALDAACPTLFAKIALFHGTVEPAAPAMVAKQCVPLSWFGSGYDAILLGDIHLQQVHRIYKQDGSAASLDGLLTNNTATCIERGLTWRIRDPDTGLTVALSQPWGYAGSIIQQHFGEPLIGHGFLHWNLEACTVDRYHILNDCGWITLKEGAGVVGEEGRDLLDHPAFPKSYLHVRIRDTEDATVHPVLKKLKQRAGLNLQVYTLLRASKETGIGIGTETDGGGCIIEGGEGKSLEAFSAAMCDIHDPSSWCRFIEEKTAAMDAGNAGHSEHTFGDAWKAFFQKEQWKKSLLPEDDLVRSILPEHVLSKIRERNAKIEKLYSNYEQSPDHAASHGASHGASMNLNASYKILGLEWSYLLCYGEECQFRFDAVPSDSIIAMNGRNGHGKTSFLEVLCIALFGEGFPSRATKQGSIIHHAKPPTASAWSRIEIALPNEPQYAYVLYRDFTTATKSKQATLMRMDAGRPGEAGAGAGAGAGAAIIGELLHRGKTAVDAWVRQTLGTLDGFLMGGMMTQHEDRDFFSLKSLEQRDLLDRALGMHASTRFVDWLKEARLGHVYVLDLVQALLQDVKKSQMLSEEDATRIQQERDDIRATLASLRTEEAKQDARLQECMQRLDADPEWLQKGRTVLEDMLASLQRADASEHASCTEQAYMDTLAMLRSKWAEYDPKDLATDVQEPPIEPPTRSKADAMADWKRYGAWVRKQKTRMVDDMARKDATDAVARTDATDADADAMEETLHRQLQSCEERLVVLLEDQRLLHDVDRIPEKPSVTLRECNATCDALVDVYGSIEVLLQSIRVLQMHEAARVETLPMTEEAYQQAKDQMRSLEQAPENGRLENDGPAGILGPMIGFVRDIRPWVQQRMDSGTTPSQKATLTKKIMDRATDFFTSLGVHTDIAFREPDDPFWWTDVLACVRTGAWKASYDRMTECMADLHRTRADLQRHQEDLQVWMDAMAQSKKAQAFEDWQQNVKRVRSEVEQQQLLLRTLQERIENDHARKERAEMEELGREAQEALNAIAHWEKHQARCAWTEYQAMEARLKNLRIRQHASKALACIDVWEEIREIRDRLTQGRADMARLQKKFAILTERWERHVTVSTKHAHLDALVKQVRSTMEQLMHVTQWMESGYKAWAYQHQIIPMIEQRVNAVMRAFQANASESERILFQPDVVDTAPMTLNWYLRIGMATQRVPLEKASGFQRFLVRLAMRMVLGHLHVGDMVCRPSQLFLDEGFTACDAIHLTNVPTFLRCLLSMYDQIVLVSHLEEVREQTDVHVRIEMQANGFSTIR